MKPIISPAHKSRSTLDFFGMLDDLMHLLKLKGFSCSLASRNDVFSSAFDLFLRP